MTEPNQHSTDAIVVFVESIRWLGVRWGLGPVCRGLRRAGFDGEFIYWRWHATWRGWLVLPAIMDRGLLERQARRLADFIAARRRERPDSPIHVIGYSCGAYVALRALELLPRRVQVESAVFLAGAFDPTHDLTEALAHVRGRIINCHSRLELFIVGLGTCMFGTGDRSYGVSAGMVGLRHPSARNERVTQIAWRPGMMADGYFGGHFTAPAARFIAKHVIPLMGIGPGSE